jgi:hypothetical protein
MAWRPLTDGRVGERLVYRGDEAGFELIEAGRAYAFDADGALLRLASEAYRIRLAHLLDPYLAVTVVHGSAGWTHWLQSPIRVHAIRTDSGRPSSSIRFRAWTAMVTSVA